LPNQVKRLDVFRLTDRRPHHRCNPRIHGHATPRYALRFFHARRSTKRIQSVLPRFSRSTCGELEQCTLLR
jgi:hypothetical protein